MGKVITDTEVQAYYERGYHFPVPVLAPEEVSRTRAALERSEGEHGGPLATAFRHKTHLLLTACCDLVFHPRVLDAVEDVLGPNLLCWSTSFFTKEARSEDVVTWHQDATYWGLSENDVVTAWIALSPSTVESGCMRVIPGSHREQVPHADTFAEHNLLSRGQEIAVDVDESQAVDIVLQPGEMSLHHVLIFHGSQPNRSADRRIGYAIRYIPTHVKQVAGPKDHAMLVRGEDAYGHFELEPRPTRDFDPEMVALHQSICDRQAKILYRGTDKGSFE